ncbi:keratin-associated protein 19-2-like [Penaeus japonicus]|uniref:keratin-associated protein 19-2-like n=1 Tax=Penaeus japonicus TaxID=27405 RepID=UPI001C70C4C9|nr:keratin-associated protein 19-2-like [Penaeus japonicus]
MAAARQTVTLVVLLALLCLAVAQPTFFLKKPSYGFGYGYGVGYGSHGSYGSYGSYPSYGYNKPYGHTYGYAYKQPSYHYW